jgi:hypothetical protein
MTAEMTKGLKAQHSCCSGLRGECSGSVSHSQPRPHHLYQSAAAAAAALSTTRRHVDMVGVKFTVCKSGSM